MMRVYTLFIDPYLTNVATSGNRYRVNCMIYNCVREKVSCMMLDDTKKMSCYGNVQTKSTMFRGAD